MELIKEWKECIDLREVKTFILFDVFRELWIE